MILGRVEAVVMAAGEGRRLRPLTERYAKPVLPIDGRPVIVTLLHELRAAGIERSPSSRAISPSRSRRCSTASTSASSRQPEPHGSADAVRRGLDGLPALVLGADTVFTAGRHRAFRRRRRATRSPAAATRRRHRRTATRSGSRTAGSRRCSTTTRRTGSPRRRSGGSARSSTGRSSTTSAGPRTSSAEAFQSLIDAGEIVYGVEIGPTRDLTDPLDLVEENFPYLRAL